jgi:hypothetical protein
VITAQPHGRTLSHNNNNNNNNIKSIMAPASRRVRRSRTTTATTTGAFFFVPARRPALPLLLVSILLLLVIHGTVVQADFSETDCLNCVGSRYISDNLSNTTYCEVDGVGFETDPYDCVAETHVSTLCMSTGDKFYIGQDCRDEEETTLAATIVGLIILCGCCVGIIGGIVACVCCCVKAGQPHHPHPPPQYHHDPQYRASYGASTVTTSGVGSTAAQPSLGVQPPANHHHPHPLHHQQQVLPVVLPGVFQQQQPSATPSGISVQSGTTIATPVHQPPHHQERQPHEQDENPAASFLGNNNNEASESFVPFAEAVALDQSVTTANNKPIKLSVISIDP